MVIFIYNHMKKLIIILIISLFLISCRNTQYTTKLPYLLIGNDVTVLAIKEKNNYQTKKMTKEMYLYLQKVNCHCGRYIINLKGKATGVVLFENDEWFLNEDQYKNILKATYDRELLKKLGILKDTVSNLDTLFLK